MKPEPKIRNMPQGPFSFSDKLQIPVPVTMTILGHLALISTTSLGPPYLVSVTIVTRF